MSLRRDLAALYAGYYVAELLSDLTDFHDPHPRLFDAATGDLAAPGRPGRCGRGEMFRFELACLRELGLMPALDDCAHCGAADRSLRATAFAFGLATGGVICPACRPGQPHVATLSGADPGGDPGPIGARGRDGEELDLTPRRPRRPDPGHPRGDPSATRSAEGHASCLISEPETMPLDRLDRPSPDRARASPESPPTRPIGEAEVLAVAMASWRRPAPGRRPARSRTGSPARTAPDAR